MMKVGNDVSALPFIQDRVPVPAGVESVALLTPIHQDRTRIHMSEKGFEELITKANKVLKDNNTELKVSFHEGTNQMMIKVINSDTHEVLKEIPPEKLVDLVYNLCELAGIFTDYKI